MMGGTAGAPVRRVFSLRDLICARYGDVEVTAWVRALQVEMADRAVLSTSIMTIVAVPALVWSFRTTAHTLLLLLGTAALLLVSGLRLVDVLSRRRSDIGAGGHSDALRKTTALAAGTAIAWALLITGIGRGTNADELTFIICLHIALVSAGSASLASIPAASLAFVTLLGGDALLNISIGIWPLMPVAQLLLLMFLAMMIRAALGQARVLAERGISEIDRDRTERARNDERAAMSAREAKRQIQAEGDAARARHQAEADAARARHEHEQALRSRHDQEMLELAQRFEATVLAGSTRVLEAAAALEGSSRTVLILGTTIETETSAVDAATAATRRAAERVTSTTSGVHGMASNISVQVAAQAEASFNARRASEQSDASVRSLAEQVDGIERITALIGSIAARTNMLALNATIEATRAGEAGRGFAVVAGEVKLLATQTRDATHDIDCHLKGMQRHVHHAASSIADTVDQLGSLTQSASTIKAAASEQQSATKRIHADADEASVGTALLNERFESMARATKEAGTLSEEMRRTAHIVMAQTAQLRDASSAFIARLKAA
ncbi:MULTISPECIES: methyl-accepting chemotaxis protein [unclassified Sphingomonas]|uniref:methyl-accepting chemotaxis protein n=1 Tax=unclassified Sphingomonas TaxID=196159 RepID=UPI00226ACA1B|nr:MULTISPECIES: methyl-accepting chemotaxis protein [unclassified Sphingomonas]